MNPRVSQPFSLTRTVGSVAAVLVLALTATALQRAQAAVSAPNHSEVTLTAGSGGFSSAITLPINNSPVMVTATTLTVGHRGTGSMHITHANAAPATVSWAGVGSNGSTTVGTRTTTGDDILQAGTGALNIGPNLNQLRVRNTQTEGFSVTVVVETIW
jgi:hypothetical protein